MGINKYQITNYVFKPIEMGGEVLKNNSLKRGEEIRNKKMFT